MNDFVLWVVGQFLTLLVLAAMVPFMTKEMQQPVSTPTYCIQSHPDYDKKKCETEDPLHRWRRLQEERIIRQSEWRDKGCKCSEIPENEQDKNDPFSYSEREKCEQACGLRPYSEYEFEDAQTDAECDPSSPDYNEEKCETEDPLYKWRRLQEERVAREEKLEGKDCTCLHPIENEDPEDPLHKWRRLQCERVCKDTNKSKPD